MRYERTILAVYEAWNRAARRLETFDNMHVTPLNIEATGTVTERDISCPTVSSGVNASLHGSGSSRPSLQILCSDVSSNGN